MTRWIDTSDLDHVRRLNPHADNGKITEDGNTNLIVHSPPYRAGARIGAGRSPWQGTELAIHLIRFMSVVLGAVTVYLGYRLVLEIWPQRWALALAAAGLTAFNPMFLFISGAVNNDNLAMSLCALGIWLLVRLVERHGGKRSSSGKAWWFDVVVLGLVLGLAVLTKTSAMGLLPLTALAVSFVAWKRHSWRWFVGGGVVTAGLVLLLSGWWFLRNALLYDMDWLGLERFVLILGYRVPPATLRQLWSERVGFMMAYWGLFGGVNVSMPAWIYVGLNGVLVLSGVGLVVGLIRQARTFGRWLAQSARSVSELCGAIEPIHVQILLLALWPLVVLVSWAGWATRTWSSQGRLVFSAITALSAWMALGLDQLVPRRVSSRVPSALVPGAVATFLLGVALWVPWGVIAPAYQAPLLAAGTKPMPDRQLQADMGGQLRLLGYDVENVDPDGWARVQPAEAVRFTLYWEALGPMDRDWSIFAHVLDSDLELPLAVRDRYPGQGLLATSEMEPGTRWSDRYVIWLDETAYSPSQALLEVGLYDLSTGERPPIVVERGEGAEVLDNALRFQPLRVEGRTSELPNPLSFQMEDQLALVGWDVEPRVVSAGELLYLTLYWDALAPISQDYQLSTQVVGEGQRKVAQLDASPGGVPTSAWRTGERIVDRRELQIDSAAPPGGYEIIVSVYGWETPDEIRRLRITDGEGYVLPGDSLKLGLVRVVP
jgi:hypothetical protein